METTKGVTGYFGKNLAELLSDKIIATHKNFDKKKFIKSVAKEVDGKTLIQRVECIADNLQVFLPPYYPDAVSILLKILGPENEKETGMFINFYWLMPVGKFVEKYGLEHFPESISAIEEITKRNTGEYAIRPFVRKISWQNTEANEEMGRIEKLSFKKISIGRVETQTSLGFQT